MTIPQSWPRPTRPLCVKTPSQARYPQALGTRDAAVREPYSTSLCTLLLPTLQLIQTISVVDRDEPQGGHRFYFRLVPEAPSNPHFSLLDIEGEPPFPGRVREGGGWLLVFLPCSPCVN